MRLTDFEQRSIKKLEQYLSIAKNHASKLKVALEETAHIFPLDHNKLNALSMPEFAFCELVISRFSKLQDQIGAKVFPAILDQLGESALYFIDRLNKLEKFGFLDKTVWWLELRDLRNELAHDYQDSLEEQAQTFNKVFKASQELLDFFEQLEDTLASKKGLS